MKRHLASRLIGTTSSNSNSIPATTTTSTNHNLSQSPVPLTTKPSTLMEALNHSTTASGVPAVPLAPLTQLRTAVSNPLAFENSNEPLQQQLSTSLNYDGNDIVSDSFYHNSSNISSNESAISAPSKFMHPASPPHDIHNADVTNPRLFTTWSSFGTTPTQSHAPPRSTTPVQLYAGQQSAIGQPRRSLPRTKDIGMNIIEPNINDPNDTTSNNNTIITTSENIQSHRIQAPNSNIHHHDNTNQNQNNDGTITSDTTTSVGTMMNRSIQELERGIQNLWSPEAHEFQQPPPSTTTPTVVPPPLAGSMNHPIPSSTSGLSHNHNHPLPLPPHAPSVGSNNFYHSANGSSHPYPVATPFLQQQQQHQSHLSSLPISPSSNYMANSSSHSYGGGPPSGNSSISDPVTTYSSELTPHQVEIDLQPYCWDSTLSSKFGVSRTLVLLYVSQHYIRISDVRTACETFGVLESFRADFVAKFGIYFISYYDIRSAQYASVELQSILQRISVMSRSNDEVVVQFCLSLNSSSSLDESQIIINNLPTTHHHMNESTIMSMLSSYGAVRTMQFLINDDGHSNGTNSCLVEFQNIQDTKQALLELDNSQPFGSSGGIFSSNNVITVHVKPRDENERRRGRDLLALLSRWRHNNAQNNGIGLQQQQLNYLGMLPNSSSTSSAGPQHHQPTSYHGMNGSNNNSSLPYNKFNPSGNTVGDGIGFGSGVSGGGHMNTNTMRHQLSGVPTAADPWFRDSTTSGSLSTPHMNESVRMGQQQSGPHYVLGPDGRYTQSNLPKSVNNTQYDLGSSANHNVMDRLQQQHYHSQQRSNGGQFYPPHQQSTINHQNPNHRYSSDRSVSPHQPSMQQHHNLAFNNERGRNHHQDSRSINSNNGMMTNHHHTPYYTHTVTPTDSNSVLGRSLRSGSGHSHMTPGGQSHGTSVGNTSGMDNNLMMDLDLVEIGQDTRTSLMVRNIPNKYTQQMLLSEFDSNGHGPGIIDFFYLPIDFKNRCNRGYAFINFVNYKDILGFHRRYFGKHWRTFNSDKICDITYARIQGKDAMLKRFENSALMEKDDEYKPLVFASNGPNRGTRLPFPDPMNIQQLNHHQQQHGHNSSNHHHLQPQSHRQQNNQHHANTMFNTTSSTASMDSRTDM